MQRQRLDGWIVKQIECTDHSKEAMIQGASPTKASKGTSGTVAQDHHSFSPQHSSNIATPRRQIGIPSGDPYGELASPLSPSPSSPNSAPSPRNFTHHKRFLVSEKKDKAISSEWQQRIQESVCDVVEEEEGKVDRTKIVKDTRQEETNVTQLITSPLMTWGLPRELILEYIRQTVLPVSWSM
jgi:hypothetical protein